MDLDPDPNGSGATEARGVSYEQSPELPERSPEVVELKALINAGLSELNNSINVQFSGIHDHILALSTAVELNQERTHDSTASPLGVGFGAHVKVVLMLILYGAMKGIPKKTLATTRLFAALRCQYRFKSRPSGT